MSLVSTTPRRGLQHLVKTSPPPPPPPRRNKRVVDPVQVTSRRRKRPVELSTPKKRRRKPPTTEKKNAVLEKEIQLQNDLATTISDIKAKYKEVKEAETADRETLDKSLAPLTEPLRMIVERGDVPIVDTKEALLRTYLHNFARYGTDVSDPVFGIRETSDGFFYLGSKPVRFDLNGDLLLGTVRYPTTPGLYELLFKRSPDANLYKASDLVMYKQLLLASRAHLRGYSIDGGLNAGEGDGYVKYHSVVRALRFPSPVKSPPRSSSNDYKKRLRGGAKQQQQQQQQGMGVFVNVPTQKRKNKKGESMVWKHSTQQPIDYVHWDDANELVNRLRLLNASTAAGHTAHHNEILSIEEELREAGIIA